MARPEDSRCDRKRVNGKRRKLEDGLFCSINVIFHSSFPIMTEELQDAGRTIWQMEIVM
jgi:hypothetical protein